MTSTDKNNSLLKVLVPYIMTILVCFTVAVIFNIILEKNVNSASLTPSNPPNPTIDTIKTPPATQEKFPLDNDSRIKKAIDKTNKYLNNDTFINSTFSEIYFHLKSLYSIQGLSDSQNKSLRTAINLMEKHKKKYTKKTSTPTPREATPTSTKSNIKELKSYVVKENDTAFSLSKKFNISIDSIAKLNNLTKEKLDTIRLNDTLILPQ